ncbi:MAG TPA: FAD-binding oxidoreductase [Pirellulales bacterium]|nr:FAD-binding oxidoreductase [Pirellulales bacterium]
MAVVADNLPLTETLVPVTQEELAAVVARASASATPIYPMGGGTALVFGMPARKPGFGLATTGLARVIDYPARDMTITVEAGITIEALSKELAAHGQRLPIDVPQPSQATLGGVVATAASGPRRFGHGAIRDFVIGISAVDGRGVAFKAGGRVVKNVAGYDFCKLLTGSRGALAVITQVTLKLRPVAEATAFVVCDIAEFDQAEPLLAGLGASRTTPMAVELLAGPAWEHDPALGHVSSPIRARLAVGFEGTAAEVKWQTEQLLREWKEHGARGPRVVEGAATEGLWSRLAEFPAAGNPALVVKATMRSSAVATFMQTAAALAANCSLQAHAASGIVYVQFPEFTAADALNVLVRGLQPAAVKADGHATVYSCAAGIELTHQAVWGPIGADAALMTALKKQFDPQDLLNPGLSIFVC